MNRSIDTMDFMPTCGDMDFKKEVSTLPILVGRFTPRRRAIVQAWVDECNADLRAPYGISPNGYAYTCGCSHDCCGCVTRRSIVPVYIGNPDGLCALHIELTTKFNY